MSSPTIIQYFINPCHLGIILPEYMNTFTALLPSGYVVLGSHFTFLGPTLPSVERSLPFDFEEIFDSKTLFF